MKNFRELLESNSMTIKKVKKRFKTYYYIEYQDEVYNPNMQVWTHLEYISDSALIDTFSFKSEKEAKKKLDSLMKGNR